MPISPAPSLDEPNKEEIEVKEKVAIFADDSVEKEGEHLALDFHPLSILDQSAAKEQVVKDLEQEVIVDRNLEMRAKDILIAGEAAATRHRGSILRKEGTKRDRLLERLQEKKHNEKASGEIVDYSVIAAAEEEEATVVKVAAAEEEAATHKEAKEAKKEARRASKAAAIEEAAAAEEATRKEARRASKAAAAAEEAAAAVELQILPK
jgi:hypothetical protein